MNAAQGWEATEASTPAWAPATDIDWDADTGPVRPPRGNGKQPAGTAH